MNYQNISSFILYLAAAALVVFLAICDDSHKDYFASALGLLAGLWILRGLIRIFAEKLKEVINNLGGF